MLLWIFMHYQVLIYEFVQTKIELVDIAVYIPCCRMSKLILLQLVSNCNNVLDGN